MRLAIFDYGAGNLHSLTKALQAPGVVVSVETDPHRLLLADALVLPGVGAFGPAAARLASGRAQLVAAFSAGMPCLGICLGMQLLFDASDESPGSPGLGIIAGQVTRLRAARVPHMGWNTVAWNTIARNTVGPRTLAPQTLAPDMLAPHTVAPNMAASCKQNASGSTPDATNATDSPDVFAASALRAGNSRGLLASEASPNSEPDVAYFAHSYACRPRDESVVTAWTVEDADRFPSAVRWRNVVGVQFHPEKSSAPGVRFIQDFLGAV